jgi:hypothetical protein
MKKLNSFPVIMILVAVLFWGCEKKENPPALPPVATMKIDFSNFAVTGKGGIADAGIKGIAVADKSNWTIAATTAGFWNLILVVNLAIPVTSFALAVDKTPVYIDNRWVWTYDFNVIGATYKARLTGQVRSSDVKWEMYIAREGIGAFPEILWYEGTSKLDGKSGQWILKHSQQFPEPMLQIDWEITGTEVGMIKYTYIRDKKDDRSTDPFKNSYIQYGVTTNILDAYYNVHQNTGVVNVFNDIFIEWSTTKHNGHIKANNYFQDNLWHCWNETGDNVICN